MLAILKDVLANLPPVLDSFSPRPVAAVHGGEKCVEFRLLTLRNAAMGLDVLRPQQPLLRPLHIR
ncbi:UNVERIFIED_CONTAM: hypothetical protein NCL1_16689 [Trichonephila clavipes]